MDIKVRTEQMVPVVEPVGELTLKTAPEVEQQILAQAQPGGKLILDMAGVPYMASAGLRMLLVMHRTISSKGGRLVLVGLCEDLRKTLEVTGFLDFLTYRDTLEAALADC